MRVIALVILIAIAASIQCVAGTTGVMNGYVRDERGRPGADLLVIAASPSDTRKTYTDKNGFFVFVSLPPDVYAVQVQKAGTSNAYALGVRINSDQTTFLNFRFNPYRLCPGVAQVTLATDQRSEQFESLDVRRIENYPPNMAPPIFLPIAPTTQTPMCL